MKISDHSKKCNIKLFGNLYKYEWPLSATLSNQLLHEVECKQKNNNLPRLKALTRVRKENAWYTLGTSTESRWQHRYILDKVPKEDEQYIEIKEKETYPSVKQSTKRMCKDKIHTITYERRIINALCRKEQSSLPKGIKQI